jgi:threonine/homoserine/homoserine lactone efflux protein
VTPWLSSIALLAFVMAATPGPNNILFAAAGARNGYLQTVPMLGGMVAGFIALLAGASVGVAGLIQTVPGSRLVLTLVGSSYVAYLAVRLWRATSPSDDPSDDAAFMTWQQMALFQLANPKTWLAVLAFVTGKLGPNSPGGAVVDLIGAACFLTVVLASASLWAVFGAALRSRLSREYWRRSTRLMACLAVLTIPTLWW